MVDPISLLHALSRTRRHEEASQASSQRATPDPRKKDITSVARCPLGHLQDMSTAPQASTIHRDHFRTSAAQLDRRLMIASNRGFVSGASGNPGKPVARSAASFAAATHACTRSVGATAVVGALFKKSS